MAKELLPDLSNIPKLRLHLDDLTHDSSSSFFTLIDCKHLIPNAVKHIINHLYTPYGLEGIPKIRSVTIVLRDMGGVAYTTGINLDDMHKEIHISLQYLAGMCKEPMRFRDEAIGVVTHEMVHCFQNNCKGTAPGGLIEGIADYVRLKAGLAPPHWKKEKGQMGEKWDEGYQKTAWFLEWLEKHRGAGTISRMNETMGRCEYDEDKFWPELFGEKIGVLWKLYQASWDDDETIFRPEQKSEDADANAEDRGSPADTEPEIVDLNAAEKEEAEIAFRPKEWKA